MQQVAEIRQWLDELHSDGIHLRLHELLRYQRQTQWLDLSPKQQIQNKLAGSYLAKSKGRGMEFDEVRHYQSGDDVRTIDWRVTARTGKVHTKLFREEKERPVFICTDLSQSMQFGSTLLFKSVQAAHLAAMIAWHVKKTGDKLGGLLFNQQSIRELKPAGRSIAVMRYLHQLIELQTAAVQQFPPLTTETPPFAEALGQLRRLVKPGSLVFIISDFRQMSEPCWRHLQAIRQHNEIRFCQITDPLDHQLPQQASGFATVSDHSGRYHLQLANSKLKADYQQQQRQLDSHLQQQWRQLGCRFWQFSAAKPLLLQVTGHSA